MIYLVRLWIYSVSSRDFSVRLTGKSECCSCFSVNVVSSCYLLRSFSTASSLHVLEFPTCRLCAKISQDAVYWGQHGSCSAHGTHILPDTVACDHSP